MWVVEGEVRTFFLILMLWQRDPVVDLVDFLDLPWLCAGREDHDSPQPLLAAEENPCTV